LHRTTLEQSPTEIECLCAGERGRIGLDEKPEIASNFDWKCHHLPPS
jgi:hypothetical protein